jgi:DNA-binding winged helix-turn-helix (wHTH) protein
VNDISHSSQRVRFGIFEADLRTGELWKSGRRLKLTGQPFSVLAILLERSGEVVSREELQRRLWPDTFVDVDHNLNTAIKKIRETLADSAERPRFVEMLSRRGYRFIAAVGSADSETNAKSADATLHSGRRMKNSSRTRAEDGLLDSRASIEGATPMLTSLIAPRRRSRRSLPAYLVSPIFVSFRSVPLPNTRASRSMCEQLARSLEHATSSKAAFVTLEREYASQRS